MLVAVAVVLMLAQEMVVPGALEAEVEVLLL
jgi:hypothetical protein